MVSWKWKVDIHDKTERITHMDATIKKHDGKNI